MKRIFRTVLVEKNRIMQERLASVLENNKNFELAAKFDDVNDALEKIAIHAPNIILLDIDDNDIDTLRLVRVYVQMFPRAGIICTSRQWSETIAKDVVGSGAKGFIIKPFSAEELLRALVTFERSGLGTISEVFAFFSPKGKSGRTTVIANLAAELAARTGENVAVVDADVQFGDMAVFFNLTPDSTIVEAVRDVKFLSPVTLDSYLTEINPKLKILCGTKRPELAEYVTPQALTEIIGMLRTTYRYILIDLPPTFNPISVAGADAADCVFVLTMINGTYEVEHMRRALDIFKVWEDYDRKVKPVFSRVVPCDEKMHRELEGELGEPILVTIPNEYALVSESANNARLAIETRPESAFADSIRRIADFIGHRYEADAP